MFIYEILKMIKQACFMMLSIRISRCMHTNEEKLPLSD